MTRDKKAALRAEGRERRRRPSDDEPQNGGEPRQKDEEPTQEDGQREERPRPKREPQRGAEGGEIAEMATHARELLRSVRGVDAESVSGIGRTPNGWTVTLEVVEVERVPDSTDVLASYAVELDDDGNVLAYERLRRYYRAQSDSE